MSNNDSYALVTLVGFGPSSVELRCRVTERRDGMVWVLTADLRDAGSPFVVPEDRVRPEPGAPTGLRHRDGLVVLG